jgi:hypothetical protein
MSWLYEKKWCEASGHTDISLFGGWIKAGRSMIINPGTWFIYVGERIRLTVNKLKTFGLGFEVLGDIRSVFFHVFWRRVVVWFRPNERN